MLCSYTCASPEGSPSAPPRSSVLPQGPSYFSTLLSSFPTALSTSLTLELLYPLPFRRQESPLVGGCVCDRRKREGMERRMRRRWRRKRGEEEETKRHGAHGKTSVCQHHTHPLHLGLAAMSICLWTSSSTSLGSPTGGYLGHFRHTQCPMNYPRVHPGPVPHSSEDKWLKKQFLSL